LKEKERKKSTESTWRKKESEKERKERKEERKSSPRLQPSRDFKEKEMKTPNKDKQPEGDLGNSLTLLR